MRCMNLDSASFKGLGGFFCFVLFFWPCTFKKKKKKRGNVQRNAGSPEAESHGRPRQERAGLVGLAPGSPPFE